MTPAMIPVWSGGYAFIAPATDLYVTLAIEVSGERVSIAEMSRSFRFHGELVALGYVHPTSRQQTEKDVKALEDASTKTGTTTPVQQRGGDDDAGLR